MGRVLGAVALAIVVATLGLPSAAVPAPASETFDGGEGAFVTSRAFWSQADRGLAENPDWLAESGSMLRREGTGEVAASVFRMWTRRNDLAFSEVAMDVRFNGWTGGSSEWHGVSLWLNRRLRTPADGTAVDDAPQQQGYVVTFVNRNGEIYIQKKVDSVYYSLKQDTWQPIVGRWYRWGGRVIDNGDGTSTIQVLVDGRVVQQAVDDGSVGGPRPMGGRVGLSGDYADFNVDNLTITRPSSASTPPPPASPSALLSTKFDGADDAFVSSGAFWSRADDGITQNPDWFAESGSMFRRSGTGRTTASQFRMWTRRKDLAFSNVSLDVRFNNWTGGSLKWHGVNLWLNYRLRTPRDGSKVNDGRRQEGYTIDFINRDGRIYIEKKVGDAYYVLKQDAWRPVAGRWYRWGGRVIDNANGTSTIQVLVNGEVIQRVIDDGSVGGPRFLGGRVGLRGDYADFNVDNLTIDRP